MSPVRMLVALQLTILFCVIAFIVSTRRTPWVVAGVVVGLVSWVAAAIAASSGTAAAVAALFCGPLVLAALAAQGRLRARSVQRAP
jgi:hypothetical protein